MLTAYHKKGMVWYNCRYPDREGDYLKKKESVCHSIEKICIRRGCEHEQRKKRTAKIDIANTNK